jgi:CheY-like chemotaxis protein
MYNSGEIEVCLGVTWNGFWGRFGARAAALRPADAGSGTCGLAPAVNFGLGSERMGNLGHVPLISVVDDDESIRVATRALLRSLGWAVHTFASAEDFLHSPHVNDTSCLIVDVQMPGMSGVELQRVLKARGHSTPVIFISAFPEDRIRAQILEAGAICFLSKPFDEQSLIGCLDRALKS